MSNIHSELTDAQLHNPKGFDTAANDTVLIKNSSGNLHWDTIHDGMTCGIYSNYDYGRWSHVAKTFDNTSILVGIVNLTNTIGAVSDRLQLDIVVSTPTLGGAPTDPSTWGSAIGSSGQEIITNAMGDDARIAAASPSFTTIGNPGIGRVRYQWSMMFDVVTSPMTSITVKIGSTTTKVCDETESYILVRKLCKLNTVQDLG